MLFLEYEKYLVYMDFSYAMLPVVCALYYAFRTRKKRLLPFVLFAAGFLEMFTFGARAPLLFVLLFIAVYELLRTDKRLSIKIVLMVAFAVAVVLFGVYEDTIIAWLNTIPMFSDSRVLRFLSAGKLMESESRDMITMYCEQRINTMGMAVSGFWGDRKYCGGQAYPHNIFLEILMTYGWVFGIIAFLLLALLCIKALLKKGINRDVVVFLLVSLWGRYLISGSYIQEGKFWIGLFALIAVAFGCKNIKKTSIDFADISTKEC